MHEYHEAIHIIEHAVDQAKAEGKNKVTKINLVIGESSGFSGTVSGCILKNRSWYHM